MGSTNKTNTVGLSQFLDDDRPTWRGDYNGDNALIDAAISDLNGKFGDVSTKILDLVKHEQVGVLVSDFGAVGDGVADDSSAFNSAIAKANTLGNNANGLGGVGVTIYVPPGKYRINNGLTTPITVDNVFIVGSSMGASSIITNSGTLFNWSNTTKYIKGGGVTDISFICETPDATQLCFNTDYAGELLFENIKFGKVGRILSAGTSSSRYSNGIRFNSIRGTAYNIGVPVFDLKYGAGFYITDVDMVGDGVGYPNDNTSMHPAAVGRSWINVSDGASWDTISEVQVITNRFYDGVNISAAPGSNIVNIKLTNVWHDYNARSAIRAIGSGGNVTKIDAVNCYFVATDGHGVQISANSGLFAHIHFTNCTSIYSGMSNWRIEGSSVTYTTLTDCYGIGGNRLFNSNTGDQLDSLVVSAEKTKIIGGYYGLDGKPYNGLVNQNRYGANFGQTLRDYKIVGTTLDGSTNQQIGLDTNTAGGAARYIAGISSVSGASVNGVTTGLFTISASGSAMTHRLGFSATYYVSGGTVTNISVNGVQTGLTNGAITLSCNDTWTITYSVAPTVTIQIRA